MRREILITLIVCVVGSAAIGTVIMMLWQTNEPAYKWSRMLQTINSHSQKLKIIYHALEGKTITIDKSNPKFQTILGLISESSFIRRWDRIPPYAIDHTLIFYLDDGQQIYLDHENGTIWWSGIYQASVNLKLEEVLDSILKHE